MTCLALNQNPFRQDLWLNEVILATVTCIVNLRGTAFSSLPRMPYFLLSW